jgi:hypothetical protein
MFFSVCVGQLKEVICLVFMKNLKRQFKLQRIFRILMHDTDKSVHTSLKEHTTNCDHYKKGKKLLK